MIKKKQREKLLSNRTNDGKNIKQIKHDQSIMPKGSTKFTNPTGIKKTTDDDILLDKQNPLNNENRQSILAKMPLKKRLSVQFYPFDHVQFISNRLEK
jgi:hypothetical protein